MKNKADLPKDIYHLKGTELNEPSVLVLGGTHGDELVGIEVIKQLINKIDNAVVKGNLYLGFGNPEAIARGKRGVTKRNLNRCFVPKILEHKSPFSKGFDADLTRAKELAPLLLEMDYVFDIHSTSSPSKPFVCLNKMSKQHRRLLRYFPVDTILTDPDNILATDLGQKEIGTTDFFVNNYGKGLGLCYETGLETDTGKTVEVVETILNLLEKIGSIMRDSKQTGTSLSKQKIYKLSYCAIAKNEHFIYEKDMKRGWKKVLVGQRVGKYKDGSIEKVSIDGMYLFPKAEHKIKKGESLYYIAQKAK